MSADIQDYADAIAAGEAAKREAWRACDGQRGAEAERDAARESLALEQRAAAVQRARADAAETRVAELTAALHETREALAEASRRAADADVLRERLSDALTLLHEALDRHDRTPLGEWARAARSAVADPGCGRLSRSAESSAAVSGDDRSGTGGDA